MVDADGTHTILDRQAPEKAAVQPAGVNSGDGNIDTSRKMEPLSPKKRDRPHSIEPESAGSSAKRQKGVAPIKAECVSSHLRLFLPSLSP